MKKELIKNGIKVSLILLFAIAATFYIYNKFENNRSVDYSSDSLDVIYHDKSGDKIDMTKVTPVTDSVGLSSNDYSLTIKNNLTIGVNYKIKIVDNKEKILEDECGNFSIPKEDIRVSIKTNTKPNKIYNLSDLEDGILLDNKIKALDQNEITIRMWINKDSLLPTGTTMHYHGIIQVIEEDDILAINK